MKKNNKVNRIPRFEFDGIKEEYYYYYRDHNNRPVITVCIGKTEDNKWSRGVAYCSYSDNPNKKTGKDWAKERVKKAFLQKRADDVITYWNLLEKAIMGENHVPFYIKSDYNCKLTTYEKKIAKENN